MTHSHTLAPPPETVAAAPGNAVARTGRGLLIVNADDWGRDRETTDKIFACVQNGSVSSASAMVFMQDSERAAALALDNRVDTGLHLNFTTEFSCPSCSTRLREHHRRVARFLRGSRLAQVIYHPGLAQSFRYLVETQVAEYQRIYGAAPRRVDGHHHMHLCANVLLGRLLPAGTIARRNFSFQPGEKSGINRLYRGRVDRALARRHTMTDYFFSLPPLEPASRLDRIFSFAAESAVEVECHPVNPAEYRFLAGGEIFRRTGGMPVAKRYELSQAAS